MPHPSPPHSGTPSGREKPDIAGIVLAGGASRRMGRDKATLRLPTGNGDECRGPNETLLERAARRLTDAGATRIVVAIGAAGRLGPLPWDEVDDGEHAGQGPLAGLAAGLTKLEDHEVALVLAVDLPFASPPLLRWLADELVVSDAPGLIPLDAVDRRPQPLHAAYRPAAVARHLTSSLEGDERRVLRALVAAGAVEVHPPDHGDNWHRNANTPEDLPRPE